MKQLMIAAACAAMLALPAGAAERKTELVEDGKAVDSLLMRYGFDGSWVLDTQRIMLRDAYLDHYVVTLEAPCDWISLNGPFAFFPRLHERVRASLIYDVRDNQHEDCRIARIEKIGWEAAQRLRDQQRAAKAGK